MRREYQSNYRVADLSLRVIVSLHFYGQCIKLFYYLGCHKDFTQSTNMTLTKGKLYKVPFFLLLNIIVCLFFMLKLYYRLVFVLLS